MKLYAINNTEQQQEQKCYQVNERNCTTIVKNSVQSIKSTSIIDACI